MRTGRPIGRPKGRLGPPAEERFWGKVRKTETCWLWIGGADLRGYGKFYLHCRPRIEMTGAHRFSWALHNGPIPEGFHVCHKCDVPACVNPAHLFLGTDTDNSIDCHLKGRGPHTTLTADQVRLIRSLYPSRSQTSIAKEYGVSQFAISAIVLRKTWAWLP